MLDSNSRTLPLLELDTLRTIVAIADTGNFSAAAEVVFRTPSAVSMQVKKAEELLGHSLFHRDSRSVNATEHGELLVQHGRRVLALNREVVLRFLAPNITGSVRLGAPDDIGGRTMPDLLRRFAATHCCITVDVVIDNSADLLKKVRAGELDLALVNCEPSQSQGGDIEVVYQEPLTWAGLRNGIAYEQTPLPVSVWDQGCAWRNMGLRSLEAVGREYRVAYRSAHLTGQKAAILADLAVAPIPLSACTDGIVPLTAVHELPPLGDYAIGLLKGDAISAPALAAADHLRASFKARKQPEISSTPTQSATAK